MQRPAGRAPCPASRAAASPAARAYHRPGHLGRSPRSGLEQTLEYFCSRIRGHRVGAAAVRPSRSGPAAALRDGRDVPVDSVGSADSVVTFCRLQAGLRRLQVGLCRLQVGLCRLQVGLCRLQVGLCRLQAGLRRLQAGLRRLQVELCRLQAGLRRLQAGLCRLQPRPASGRATIGPSCR